MRSLILRQLHQEKKRERSAKPRGTKFFQDMEYEADEIGFQLSKRALEKDGLDIFFAVGGPTILLMEDELTCRAWHVLSGGSAQNYQGYPTDLNHPPPKQRLAKIREQVGKLGTSEAKMAVSYSAGLESLDGSFVVRC